MGGKAVWDGEMMECGREKKVSEGAPKRAVEEECVKKGERRGRGSGQSC